MSESKIEWTDRTWNPTRGCSVISPGCTNCYAMRQAHRFSGPGRPYEGLTRLTSNGPVWTGEVRLVPEKLSEPLGWKQPSRVFVNSMSDLFHPDLSDEEIGRVFDVMEGCPQHTFQVLTKRSAMMRRWMEARVGDGAVERARRDGVICSWPTRRLAHIHLGVSAEDHQHAQGRIPDLLGTPAAVRFVSLEPLLGHIDLLAIGEQAWALDWVIVGGESGPGARPCAVEWIRDIVQQCREMDVPVFVKQLGAWPYEEGFLLDLDDQKGADMAEWPEDLRVREFPRRP